MTVYRTLHSQPGARMAAKHAHSEGALRIQWTGNVRDWAKRHNWPTLFFGLEDAHRKNAPERRRFLDVL
jgi:hypothetical protein